MAKKNNNKLNILLLATGLLLFITAALFLFFDQVKAPKNEGENQKVEPRPINNSEEIKSANQSNITAKSDLAKIKMPILMYHYIRIVEDQSDKLGIGLSVVPSKFASQLDYIQEKGYKTINFNDIKENKLPDKPIILTFDDGYEDFYVNAYPELKKRNMTAVVFIIANNNGGNYLTSNQIKELSDNGIEIGSHTMSHIDLSKATDSKASTEISQSKEKIENIIDKKVISFCYPAGKYTDSTISFVKNAGYEFAVTTKPGESSFASTLDLTRDRMNSDTNIQSYIK